MSRLELENSQRCCGWAWISLGLALGLAGEGLRAQSDYLSPPYQFDTLAGYAGSGSRDGVGTAARFDKPYGVAADALGNVYVADTFNSTIRKISPTGETSTLAGIAGVAGIADGPAAEARFNAPFGLAVDAEGNLYIADTNNHLIRRISSEGLVTTLAGAPGAAGADNGVGGAARFRFPGDVAVDAAGNVYVADTDNHTIRLITPEGAVTTFAGTPVAPNEGSTVDGTGSAARFNLPVALALNSEGSQLFVVEQRGQVIRRLTLATAEVITLAGTAGTSGSADGLGTAARFENPGGVTVDAAGNLYVADTLNVTLRRITPAGQVTTIAGLLDQPGQVDGTGSAARFNTPSGLAFAPLSGALYVADTLNSVIRQVDPATAVVTTLAGGLPSRGAVDGLGEDARFFSPRALARDAAGNYYVADRDNHLIRKIDPAGTVSTLAGLAGQAGAQDGVGAGARFNQPAGIAVTPDGSTVYVVELGNHTLRWIDVATGQVGTLAGQAGMPGATDGTGTGARFHSPLGLTLAPSGDLYVADFSNHTLRRVTPAGVVTTFAGTAGATGATDATGAVARFFNPGGIAADSSGHLYVTDFNNHVVRKISPSAAVTTLAGEVGFVGSLDATGTAARFFYPYGVALDNEGFVYVTDYGNHLVRRISPTGVVRTVAGTAQSAGVADGLANAARFSFPQGILVDPDGRILVADTGNNAVRVGSPAPISEITSPLTAAGQVGQAFTPYTIEATLNPILFGATGLPSGLVIDTNTGIISGTPWLAGQYSATISAQNVGGIGTATLVLTVAKGEGTVTLGELSTTFDGLPKSVSVTTVPADLPVVVTYNGSTTPPTDAGLYTVVATLDHPNYAGTATGQLVIGAPVVWSVSTVEVSGNPLVMGEIRGLAVDAEGAIYLSDYTYHVIRKLDISGSLSVISGGLDSPGMVNGVGLAARYEQPTGLALDADGVLWIADSGNHSLRRLAPDGTVTLFAGSGDPFKDGAEDGQGTQARFTSPMSLTVTPSGLLYVGDKDSLNLRSAVMATAQVDTVMTTPGFVFREITGLALAPNGDLYVADRHNNQIWRVQPDGTATVFAGRTTDSAGSSDGLGTAASFYQPWGLAFDANGNLYVADTGNHTIRKITPDGEVTTLVGEAGSPGSTDNIGSLARLNGPASLAFTPNGDLLVGELSGRLRRLTPPVSAPVAPPTFTGPLTSQATSSSTFFSFALETDGQPTDFAATGLPPGLSLDPQTGVVSGVPELSGVYEVEITATNTVGSQSATLTLTIAPPPLTWWNENYFTPQELENPLISGPAADPDGDGIPNLIEYAMGLDPWVADDSEPRLRAELIDGRLEFTYQQLRALEGWRLVVEFSSDLVTWSQGTGNSEVISNEDLDERREQIVVRDARPGSPLAKTFVRLTIQPE